MVLTAHIEDRYTLETLYPDSVLYTSSHVHMDEPGVVPDASGMFTASFPALLVQASPREQRIHICAVNTHNKPCSGYQVD